MKAGRDVTSNLDDKLAAFIGRQHGTSTSHGLDGTVRFGLYWGGQRAYEAMVAALDKRQRQQLKDALRPKLFATTISAIAEMYSLQPEQGNRQAVKLPIVPRGERLTRYMYSIVLSPEEIALVRGNLLSRSR